MDSANIVHNMCENAVDCAVEGVINDVDSLADDGRTDANSCVERIGTRDRTDPRDLGGGNSGSITGKFTCDTKRGTVEQDDFLWVHPEDDTSDCCGIYNIMDSDVSWAADVAGQYRDENQDMVLGNDDWLEDNPLVTAVQAGQSEEERFAPVKLCQKVLELGFPNAWQAKIPIAVKWNVELFDSLLQNYADRDIIPFMRYGWPVSRPPNWPDPTPTFSNHAGATRHPEAMNKYITKELMHGAIAGPFDYPPFISRLGVSPLSTREKKESPDRRVIMDLSWPPGRSVNDGIGKNQFLGFQTKLQFPTIDVMARRIWELGPTALMFKVDLSRFFRQIPLDPAEYSLMCFTWGGKVWFDLVSPMGLRSAPYFAQRISNAIKFIHNEAGYFLFNYIDDFLGAELPIQIEASFSLFKRLLNNLNIDQSAEKEVRPTDEITCIGVLVSAKEQLLKVTPDRLQSLWVELHAWTTPRLATLREVQVLLGKLQFVSACIRPGRLFVSRIINIIKGSPSQVEVDEEFVKDIRWWLRFMQEFNGVGILWTLGLEETGELLETDACLRGLGGRVQRRMLLSQTGRRTTR